MIEREILISKGWHKCANEYCENLVEPHRKYCSRNCFHFGVWQNNPERRSRQSELVTSMNNSEEGILRNKEKMTAYNKSKDHLKDIINSDYSRALNRRPDLPLTFYMFISEWNIKIGTCVNPKARMERLFRRGHNSKYFLYTATDHKIAASLEKDIKLQYFNKLSRFNGEDTNNSETFPLTEFAVLSEFIMKRLNLTEEEFNSKFNDYP